MMAGAIRDYDGLIAAIRARINELQITHETIDNVAGLQPGYTSKIMAPVPMKHLGPMSLGSLLGAIGLKLEAVPDDVALARVLARHEKRKKPMHAASKHDVITIKISRRMLRKRQINGGKARAAKLSRYRRVRIAKKAARARWIKRRPKASVPSGSSAATALLRAPE